MPLTLRRYLRYPSALCLALVLLVGLPAPHIGHADILGLEVTKVPTATEQQARTIKLIHYMIDKSHYRKQKLDDEFSTLVLRDYLKKLDPGKSFFQQGDVNQFEALRYRFDDFIRDGRLQPVFVMFSIFRTRIDQRVEYALARLDEPFDFKLNEEYRYNREDANWATNKKESDDLWRKRLKNDILALRLSGKKEKAIRTTLKRRYTNLARRMRQFKSEDVFQIFANAYVNTFDPYTSYFLPRASENFDIQLRLSLDGIGAVLQTEDEYTVVRRVLPGGPADLARELKAEDRIIGVAQDAEKIVDVIGWRLDDVVELIRGPKKSIVRLEILPGGNEQGKSKVIKIQRDKINLEEQAAKQRVLKVETAQGKSVNIGVIDLPSFYIDFAGQQKNLPDYRSTTRDVRKLITKFKEQGIDGLVIDLRGNGGGSLTEAITLTGLFIEKGPVVQVLNANNQLQVNKDPDPKIVYDGPLMVMVDRYSASASEIFAGAIQDYRRGLIVGEPTFGKGTVQHLVALNSHMKEDNNIGQLKMTIAQFFRINGDSTQHRGVVPDIVWSTAADRKQSGERSIENAIPWRQINSAKFQPFQAQIPKPMQARLQDLHEQRTQASPEFQYFRDVKKINDERGVQESITLNEATRKLERATRDEQYLKVENRKRHVQGKKVVKSMEALDEENSEKSRAYEEKRLEPEADAFLREGSNILADYLAVLTLPPEPITKQSTTSDN